ncbi:hypothetical protein AAM37_gp46 [Pantoea phage vB_PagM_AAM37]|uniref:Uncharacterized protein n=1 Tax=Pantoea phage vB_PagM_AAM37 TaxID=2588093 RepID=A0A513ZYF8_9CAUD|nr:hypothetical protein HWC22_gp46 [Pantoea phage vB_PagM_AAM37]QDH45717.1 hypothetical protein AAM37_gp46 [Pantoea phage vB_PagM_AAM37]
MATMVKVKCANKSCGSEFMARLADRKRGWGRFCSKSCKAVKQERRTGQHAAYLDRQNDSGSSRGYMSPSMAEGEVQ